MKNTIIIVFLVLSTAINGQKSKPSPSVWNSSGKEESKIPLENFKYFNKSKIYYHLSNDNENIFLDMRIDDSQTQNKILKQGMTVWINSDNKQIMKCGLRFPIGTDHPVRQGPGQYGQEPQVTSSFGNISPVDQANRIELTGFTKEQRRIIPAKNEDNFQGSVHYDSEGVLIYKMIIPVSGIESDKNIQTDPIALGIEIGGFSGQLRQGPPQSGASSQGFSEMPSGGGGRGGGRGGGGGRPSGGTGGSGFSGGGASPAQPGSAGTLIWIKDITLVTEK